MQNSFEEIIVTPLYPNKIFIQWSVSNPCIDTNYKFYIYISESINGPFKQINTLPLVDEYMYTFSYPILNKQEYLFFKIIAEIGKSKVESRIESFINKIYLDTWLNIQEIIRREDLLRERFTGTDCLIFKKKITGDRCNICLDKATGYITDSRCSICFGTRIIGGYLPSIEKYIEIVEGPRNITPSPIGTIENITAIASLTVPLLFKGDIIVEKKRNKRWYINQVDRNMIATYPIKQKLEIRQISPKDIEYQLN